MTARLATPLGMFMAAAVLVTGCGASGPNKAALRAERAAAVRRAHPTFAVAPCSLLSVRQVSAVLEVRAHAHAGRLGCIYSGRTRGGDVRTLTITPGSKPAAGQLITFTLTHSVTITGPGYRAQAGATPIDGEVRTPAAAAGGVLAGQTYVALLLEDANPNAPSQVPRVVALAREIGHHLYASASR